MPSADLEDITAVISAAIIDVRYAGTNNFTGIQLYDQPTVKLRHEPLEQLRLAAKKLYAHGYRIVVFDAFRPVAVQEQLRAVCGDSHYVAEVSNHCRGITVDITLATIEGEYLDMGTGYDDFSEKAHPGTKLITDDQERNRRILVDALQPFGFVQHQYEWWHFDFMPDHDWAIIHDDDNVYKR